MRHPIQYAIEALHAKTGALHAATQHIDFHAAEKESVWAILVGMLPDIIEAVGDLSSAVLQFLTVR